MAQWTQHERIMAIRTEIDHEFPGEGFSDPFLLYGLVGREGISTPFTYEARLLMPESADPNILGTIWSEPESMIATNVTITLRWDVKLAPGQKRFVNGYINRFKVLGKIKGFRVCEAEIVPWIWFMSLKSDCRIFQNKTVVDVLRVMFHEHGEHNEHVAGVSFSGIKGRYPELEYCVQYRESHLEFVSRLMEEYGIFYYFKHEDGRHTLVLADDNLDLTPFDAQPLPFGEEKNQEYRRVTAWKHVCEHRIGRYEHDDYDYEHPDDDLKTFRESLVRVRNVASWRRFDYPGRYKTRASGEQLAQIRLQEEETRGDTIEGASVHAGFESGRSFVIDVEEKTADEKKVKPANNKSYVVTALELTASESHYTEDNFWENLWKSLPNLLLDVGKGLGGAVAGSLFDLLKGLAGGSGGGGLKDIGSTLLGSVADPIKKWAEDRKSSLFESLQPGHSNSFFGVPMTLPIRAPRTTRRPEIRGPQTAFVVGPKDKEIWTDKLGRIKVRFHWDRHMSDPENATCWIRVSETWAGNEWGTLHLPRIGQEVIVDFLDADPDRPIVTGRVYHANNPPAFTLPKYQTRSGIKTRSTPQQEKGGYHMLRFEDEAGKEQLLLRSQRRTDIRTYASYFETTHANRHFLIGYNDPDTDEKGGNAHVTTGGEWNLHTGKGRYEGMDDVYHLRVTGAGINSYEADHALMVKGLCEINARAIHLEAKMKISLKVGGSFITIDPSGVAIKGPMVQINSGGSGESVGDKTILDPVDASISDNGEPGYLEDLRERAAQGGGGGHRQRQVPAQHGPKLSRNADATLQFSPGIRVDGSDPDYASAVVRDLTLIAGTAEGQRLLGNLDSSGRQVTIQPENPAPNPPNASAEPGTGTDQDYANATPAGQPVFDGGGNPINDASGNQMVGTGTGGDSRVSYNPDQWPAPGTASNAPGDVILFHEMTHSDHQEQGTYDGAPRTDNFDTNEEFNTIGPENRYRDERGVPRRHDHHDL